MEEATVCCLPPSLDDMVVYKHSGHLSSHTGGVGPWLSLSCSSSTASALVTSVSTQRVQSAPARAAPPARSVGGPAGPRAAEGCARAAPCPVPPRAPDSNASPHLHAQAQHRPPLSAPSLGPEAVRSFFTSPDPTSKSSPVRHGGFTSSMHPKCGRFAPPPPARHGRSRVTPPPPCPAITGPSVPSIASERCLLPTLRGRPLHVQESAINSTSLSRVCQAPRDFIAPSPK